MKSSMTLKEMFGKIWMLIRPPPWDVFQVCIHRDDVDKITRHLNVVRCALAKPKENNDWRRTLIFQTH